MKRVIVSFLLVSFLVLFVFLSTGANADVEQQNSTQDISQGQAGVEKSSTFSMGYIPEPGTMAVIGVGIVALALRKRPRKKAA